MIVTCLLHSFHNLNICIFSLQLNKQKKKKGLVSGNPANPVIEDLY